MTVRFFNTLFGAAIAAPVQAFELWVFCKTASFAHGASLMPLLIANLAVLVLLCALASDFAIVQRGGKAILVGVGVAVLMPGAVMLDQVVALSSPDWDATTWLSVLLPYLMLLLALSVAEAGLYLLATRPRVAP